ncbi:MAG: Jag N-terminal domain-containing protein [Clostridia bacterium]|nr:Jag N-terminal domain-containing protein [Clostridia bacterium]
MKVYEYSARSIQEAIDHGLEELGVAISDVTVDVLEEGSKGLFGLFGSRLAKVRITLKEEEASDDVARAILADAMKADEPKPRKQEKPEKPVKAEKEEKAEKPAKPRKPREPKAPKEETVKAEAAKEEAPKEKAEPKKESKPKAPRPPKVPKEPKEPKEQKEIVPAEQADRGTAAGRAQEFCRK